MGVEDLSQHTTKTKYELDYLPQKLRALDLCVLACHAQLSGNVASTKLVIDLGTSKVVQPDLNIFVELAVDAGLIANRVLLNFLGIKLEAHALTNQPYGVGITEFGLPAVPVADAVRVLSPPIGGAPLNSIWVETLSAASKAIAHFTPGGATIEVARLGFASHATGLAVRKYYYDALGKAAPPTLVPADVAPRILTVWDAVDPRYNIRL